MPDPIPSSPALIAYERAGAEPIPGVFRDGSTLVVPRGGDISRFCYCCGRPSVGEHTTKFLRSPRKSTGVYKGMGRYSPVLLDLLVLILGAILVVTHFLRDSALSDKRRLTYGFCGVHRRKRMLLKLGIALGFPIGLGMAIVCLSKHVDPKSTQVIFTTIGGILGIALTFFCLIGPFFLSGPTLEKEDAHYLWLTGAGEGLVKAQQPITAA